MTKLTDEELVKEIADEYMMQTYEYAEIISRLARGRSAIELIKECDEYLDSLYKINTISTNSQAHIKMKALLKEST